MLHGILMVAVEAAAIGLVIGLVGGFVQSRFDKRAEGMLIPSQTTGGTRATSDAGCSGGASVQRSKVVSPARVGAQPDGVLRVVRPKKMAYRFGAMTVYVDGQKVARLSSGSEVALPFPDGQHLVEVRGGTMRTDPLPIQLRGDEVAVAVVVPNSLIRAGWEASRYRGKGLSLRVIPPGRSAVD